MRIAFGTTRLVHGLAHNSVDGIGNYTRELYASLNKNRALRLQPFMYGSTSSTTEALNLGPFGAQALFSCATGLAYPVASARISTQVDPPIDLVHATDHLIPSLRRVPVVATLMDAIPLSHPEWVRANGKSLKNLIWRKSARWATHIITISNYSKHEIIKHFHLPETRISVIPLGVDARWFVSPPAAQLQQVKTRYALPERFFLFVGTLQPRKNLARLILAHKLLPQELRRECPLLVVGRAGWGCEQELQALVHAEDATMKWLNYVQDSDLVPLVSQATALVFPSLHEGFGLPILEAFAAGVPVIASNTTSIPEVAGSSALLIDPCNTGELAEAMKLMLNDESLSRLLREQGRARARTFSWDQTAAMTASVYAKVLESF